MKLKQFTLFFTLFSMLFTLNSFSQQCIQLDGDGDYVDCGNGSSLNVDNVTVELWIKADVTQNAFANIIDKHHTSGTNHGWALEFGGPHVYFYYFTSEGGGLVATSTYINDDNWHHIAATYNGDSAYMYVDGVREDGSKSATGNLQYNPSNKLYIGTAGDYITIREFTGYIEEVRVWDVALTQQTIVAWKDEELNHTHPNWPSSKANNLVAYYKLNSNVTDETGSNNGSIVGGTTYYSGSTPMGVSLIDFYYICNENNLTEISWATASETNNSHFEVQKSIDVVNYKTVEIINGKGYSNSISNYNIIINSNSDVVYYRLKQVDFDGRYEYYGPISVICNNKEINVDIYPNPFQDVLSIRLNSNIDSQLKLCIYDIRGQLVEEIIFNDKRSLYQIQIEVKLSSGLYFIKVETGTDVYTTKVLKE